jgi:hypothetical protein
MTDCSTFELTVHSTTAEGEHWLVAEWTRPGGLPIRRGRSLRIDHARLAAEPDPKRYGAALGRMVFADGVRELFAQARVDASGFRLLLAVEAKALQSLRWERLAGPFDDDEWEHLGQRAPFSLHLASGSDRRFPPFGRKDLRALVVLASPAPDNGYHLEPFDEEQALRAVLSGLGEVPTLVLGKHPRAEGRPTLSEIGKQLVSERYTLLHIVCHGIFARKAIRQGDGSMEVVRTGETAIFLDADDGRTQPVEAGELIQQLKVLASARGLPHFAFLSVCDSAVPEAEAVIGGLAQRLVRELGMPAVVAMTDKVTHRTALTLGATLYARLRIHGEVDRALLEACVEVNKHDDATVPALFSRLAGRPLFTDDLDRPATRAELVAAAEKLEPLFHERAPAL